MFMRCFTLLSRIIKENIILMHLVYVDILAHSTYLVGIAGEVVSKKGAQAQGQRPQRGRLRRAEFELCV